MRLRYLNLSNTSIKCLPDSIFKLYNLQTLILSNCECLTHLPAKIGNLVSLRHLDLSDTNLVEMPAQICRLQELRTLTVFVIGRKEDGLSIAELSNFPYLQGKLSIQQLQNVVDPMDAVHANLMNKGQIEELTLQWGSDPEDSQIEKDVLENLQPSMSLKELCIRYYGGTSFPNWVGDSSFSNIVVLRISNCNYCLSLPPFGQLPSLKKLFIIKMGMVTKIGHEFYCSNGSFSPTIFQPFPSLESLEFGDMPEWQEWLPYEDLSDIGGNFAFPCLRRLNIFNCPKLRGSLPKCLPSLRYVDIKECEMLEEEKSTCLQWKTSIEELIVRRCHKLVPSLTRMIAGANCLQLLTLYNISYDISFPDDGLPTSLRSLKIHNCVKLQFLSLETLHKYTSLQALTITNSCHSMSSFPFGCFPALQRLKIQHCPTLEAISTQPGGVAPNLFLFCVIGCGKLKSLPEQIDLPALEYLWLNVLGELASFSPIYLSSKIKSLVVDSVVLSLMFKLESGFPFQRLTSLSFLLLHGFGDEELVNNLPKKLSLPTSLEELELRKFRGLRFLEGGQGLQYLTSLKRLYISDCPKLESLPEDQLPSSLELLSIEKCPLLEARYQSQKGEHWSKIARIPAIQINEEVII
ncbi:putative disease resistance RPP13-like protein 1 [Lotus japonicus]|uniref:putative disease resistance RPP13-like protein 1 n=1 Tax=Lotus japonicus TaxID=34305 RepID=UPI00258C8D97|nr:putative disease resistance RPP13-like protein 1 [Lotus japonicus]